MERKMVCVRNYIPFPSHKAYSVSCPDSLPTHPRFFLFFLQDWVNSLGTKLSRQCISALSARLKLSTDFASANSSQTLTHNPNPSPTLTLTLPNPNLALNPREESAGWSK